MQVNNRRVVIRLAIVAHLVFRPGISLHKARLHGFLNLFKQFGYRTDADLLLPILRAPNRQRSAPVTRTGQIPVVQVLQPFAKTPRSGRFGLPIDGVIQANHLLSRLRRTDKPRVKRVVNNRRIGSPAMRIRVNVLLDFKDRPLLFHIYTQAHVDILGLLGFQFVVVVPVPEVLLIVAVLDILSCPGGVEFAIEIPLHEMLIQFIYQPILTREVHHRTRLTVLGHHIESRHAGGLSHLLIVGTKGRSDMHDTRTIFRCHIIAADDAEGIRRAVDNSIGILVVVHGLHPREELLVTHANQVCTFHAGEYFGRFAKLFLIRTQTSLCQDINILRLRAVLCRRLTDGHVVYLRTHAQGGIAGQGPRRCRPRQEIGVSICN